MKTAVLAIAILLSVTVTLIKPVSPAYAQASCPVPASRALDEAQEILQANDQAKFDIALACITRALAQTRSELEALREGRAAFSGQIHAPKGLVMSKPPVQEGR